MKRSFLFLSGRHALAVCAMGVTTITPLGVKAQSCNPVTLPTAPDSRFTIRNSGAEAFDKATGLTWQRCLHGQSWSGRECVGNRTSHTWASALEVAKESGAGWRLPNVKELLSLAEMSCEPAVNLSIFPWLPLPTEQYGYSLWSSTPSPDRWRALRVHGWRVLETQTGDALAYVRLVR